MTRTIVRGEVPDRLGSSGDDIIEQKRQTRIRKAFSLATDIGLTSSERHDLAQMIPSVDKDDGGSWKNLNPAQLHDLITMLEGFSYIGFIFDSRSG